MNTLDTLCFKHFGRKTKPFRPVEHFPLGLKLSTRSHRSNRGGEFTTNQPTAYPQQWVTECCLATADTPQHTWYGRIAQPPSRAIQHQASLPKHLSAEDIYSAIWLKNRTSTKALGSVTTYKRDFIEKSPTLPTRPNGGSKSGLQHLWQQIGCCRAASSMGRV